MNFMANPIFSYVNRIIEISFLNSLFPNETLNENIKLSI